MAGLHRKAFFIADWYRYAKNNAVHKGDCTALFLFYKSLSGYLENSFSRGIQEAL